MIRRLKVSAALLMLAIVAVGSPANAQEAGDPTVDFVVTPSRLEIRVAPDEAIEFPVQVFNRSSDPLKLTTYIQDIDIPDNDLVTGDELAFTASRWTTFQQESFVVAGGGSHSVDIRVEVPADTPSGGYHAFAFFQTDPDDVSSGVLPSGRIGVTLLVDVVPEGETLIREARVSDTSLSVSWSSPFSAHVSGSTTIQNIGEAAVMVGGLHTYRPWPTGDATEQEVGPITILRGTQTHLISESVGAPFFGKVTLTSELVYQVGPDELPVILTQASVWIIPWHVVITLTALLVLFGGTYLIIRKRRSITRAQRTQTEKEQWEPEEEPSYS